VSLKAWLGDLGDGVHDGSAKDPRIGVIKVKAKTIQYAINHKSFLMRGAEVAKGIVTGEAASVNSLREITETEIQECKPSKHRPRFCLLIQSVSSDRNQSSRHGWNNLTDCNGM